MEYRIRHKDGSQRWVWQQGQSIDDAIVDSSDDAIISKGLDEVITSWNKNAERMFEYTVAEAVGQPITMLIPVDRRDEEPTFLEDLANEALQE